MFKQLPLSFKVILIKHKLFRLVCFFCPPSHKKIFKNFVFVYNFRFDYGTIGHGKYYSCLLYTSPRLILLKNSFTTQYAKAIMASRLNTDRVT